VTYLSFASDGWFPKEKHTTAIAYGSGKFNIATLVDGGRNLFGDFVGQVIGNDKYKYEINFNKLELDELRELLRRFDRTQGGSFQHDFIVYDPARNDFVKKTMYVGDRSGAPLFVRENGRPERFLDITANLIEV